ncbi:FecR family protein [Pedobacter nyackensis]|uniref:FecR family protein n=2 Tax=Pedobacter nyackensis TaxID=475255 RepID=A0A1W2EW31_9SPHI|nr:FecR family protein [Pedobacter nyackensis]
MEQMNSNEKARIQELMVRSITSGELNSEEQAELTTWLAMAAENQQEYKDLIAVKNLLKIEGTKKPDTDAAWVKVKHRISDVPVQLLAPKRSLSWLRYAAAVIILSAIGLVIYMATNNNEKAEAIAQIIEPGRNRAELVLPDGKRVSLQNKSTLDISGGKIGLVATNKGNILVYNTNSGQRGYHKLIVPDGGAYEIILPDKTHVWVNSGSELTYRVDFSNAAIREVKLIGEAYFKVAKDKKHPFIVKTDHMDVEAVGTAFNVAAYKGADYAEATLVEGIVNVSDHMGNKQRLLAGSKIRIETKKPNILPALQKSVLVYSDYAWKDGVFVFDNMPLVQITEKFSRWYNIKVVFTNDEARQLRFTGSIEKDKTLNTALQLIGTSTNVKFEIRNGTLYITKP